MLLDDGINPRFVYLSPVHFDELDPMQMLHNGRFPAHIERAVSGWYAAGGGRWERNTADNPDQFHVVRDLHIEYLNPVLGPGIMRIDIWVERVGTSSCVYGFTCSSEDGNTAYARGERTVVKIDPATHRPAPWTERFRERLASLRKELPAYA